MNSFGMMRSLISLEAARTAEPGQAGTLAKLRDRVSVLSSLYEQLDGSSGDGVVRLDEYLRKLAEDLLAGYGAESRGVSLEVEAEGVVVDMRRAVPLGLIVNELITDSLKHAFPAGRAGRVRLELHRSGGEGSEVRLRVSDDGVGLPEGFAIGSAEGFGLNLVEILRSQIGATLEIGPPGGGASFSLSFRP
jgi:two-component sensor histidine kinase